MREVVMAGQQRLQHWQRVCRCTTPTGLGRGVNGSPRPHPVSLAWAPEGRKVSQ
jgi:hypothetical protein